MPSACIMIEVTSRAAVSRLKFFLHLGLKELEHALSYVIFSRASRLSTVDVSGVMSENLIVATLISLEWPTSKPTKSLVPQDFDL